MSKILFVVSILGILAAFSLGLYSIFARPNYFTSPYSITFEKISDHDLKVCQRDPNCMDVNTFEKEKTK